jgi:hypothetical protein
VDQFGTVERAFKPATPPFVAAYFALGGKLAGSQGSNENNVIGRPGWTRTSDPQLRRLMLYPPELRARVFEFTADANV